MKNTETSEKKSCFSTKNLAIGISIISSLTICIALASYFVNFHDKLSNDQAVWGAFGDFFGGTINPILSFCSLIALLFTIILQNKALKVSSNELELTREELKKSAKAQEDSSKALDAQKNISIKQQFDNTFFSLLDQHNTLLTKLDLSLNDNIKESLDSIYRSASLQNAFRSFRKHSMHYNQYFRVLFQILKFIALNVPEKSKYFEFNAENLKNEDLAPLEKMYSNIVRSFIRQDILELLSINCYCDDELTNHTQHLEYKSLIERYSFLEHMSIIDKDIRGINENPLIRNKNNILYNISTGYAKKAFDKSIYLTDRNTYLKYLTEHKLPFNDNNFHKINEL